MMSCLEDCQEASDLILVEQPVFTDVELNYGTFGVNIWDFADWLLKYNLVRSFLLWVL